MKKRFLKIAAICLAVSVALAYPVGVAVSALSKTGQSVSAADVITVVSPAQSAEIDLDNAAVKKYFAEYAEKQLRLLRARRSVFHERRETGMAIGRSAVLSGVSFRG